MNIVLSLRSSKMVRRRSGSSCGVTSCLLTDIFLSPVYSSTICVFSSCGWFFVCVSAGRLTSRPRCDSGRAAMKITRSTSSTSIIGVMFMSALACGTEALKTFSAPKCWWACAMLLASRRATSLSDEAHVFDAGRAKVVHRFHHRAPFDVLVGLDDDRLFLLRLERIGDAAGQVVLRYLHGVQPEPLVGRDGDNRLVLR